MTSSQHIRMVLTAIAAALALAGCGLAETTAVAGAQAASAAEQAKQAREIEAKVQRDIDAAQAAQREALRQAEEANQ